MNSKVGYQILILCLICMTLFCKAQTSDALANILKGLEKVDEKTIKTPVFLEQIISFSPEGKKLTIDELLNLLNSNEYSPTFYKNAKGEITVNVLQKLLQKERKQMSDDEVEKQMILKSLDEKRELAQSFKIKDMNDNTYTLESLKGKVIVINFWFVGCQPCEKEMPELNRLVEKYSGKNVVFLGITFNDKLTIEKFLKKKEFKYTIAPEAMDMINRYKIFAYPTQLIIDKNSQVALLSQTQSKEILDTTIEKLLK